MDRAGRGVGSDMWLGSEGSSVDARLGVGDSLNAWSGAGDSLDARSGAGDLGDVEGRGGMLELSISPFILSSRVSSSSTACVSVSMSDDESSGVVSQSGEGVVVEPGDVAGGLRVVRDTWD